MKQEKKDLEISIDSIFIDGRNIKVYNSKIIEISNYVDLDACGSVDRVWLNISYIVSFLNSYIGKTYKENDKIKLIAFNAISDTSIEINGVLEKIDGDFIEIHTV